MRPMPLSPYAVSKLAGEHYCQVFAGAYGLETVCLRYFNVFGPRQDPKSEYAAVIPRFVTAALAGQGVTIYGDGTQSRDFCFIDNTVEANLLAAVGARRLGQRLQRRLRRGHQPQRRGASWSARSSATRSRSPTRRGGWATSSTRWPTSRRRASGSATGARSRSPRGSSARSPGTPRARPRPARGVRAGRSAADLEAEQRQVVAAAGRSPLRRRATMRRLISATSCGRAADQLGELALPHRRAGAARRRQDLEHAVGGEQQDVLGGDGDGLLAVLGVRARCRAAAPTSRRRARRRRSSGAAAAARGPRWRRSTSCSGTSSSTQSAVTKRSSCMRTDERVIEALEQLRRARDLGRQAPDVGAHAPHGERGGDALCPRRRR